MSMFGYQFMKCYKYINHTLIHQRLCNYYTTTPVLRQCTIQSRYLSTEPAVLTTSGETIVEYPPVKGRLPPGDWGSTDRVLAWQWHENRLKFQSIPSISERIKSVMIKKRKWNFPFFNIEPGMLDYQQYITKSQLIYEMPDFYSQIDVEEELSVLKPLVLDAILCELWFTDSTRRHRKYVKDKQPRLYARDMIGSIIQTIVMALSAKHDYLKRSQYDEDVSVEAFWDRFGIRRRKPYETDSYMKMQIVPQDSCFQSSHTADIMLRIEQPIREIIPHLDNLCQTCSYSHFKYWPGVLGQVSCVEEASVVPGFRLGNPNEFGLLSVYLTNNYHHVVQKYPPDVAQKIYIGAGVASSFSWLVAQAYFQGFSTHSELTRPFCAQTVISDGRNFRFFAYQLNTLALWKDDTANPVQNLCWCSDDLPLYDRVENGELIGFNDDVLRWLLKFALNQPISAQRQPDSSLPFDYVPSRDENLIAIKEEEVIVVEEEKLYE